MRSEFYGQILGKYSDIEFHENPYNRSRVLLLRDGHTDRQTDKTKLIVQFPQFGERT